MKNIITLFIMLLVTISLSAQNIIAYEYWFDDDTATKTFANVTPSPYYEFNQNVDVSALNDGLHKFNIRFLDDSSRYSSVTSSFFQVLPNVTNVLDTANRQIVETIYWIDEDYANRTVTPNTAADFVDFMANIDVSALNNGLHKYNFRAKDDAGQYSSVVSSFFQKLPNNLVVLDTANRKIIAAEYWFNDDYGNKVSLTVSPTDFYNFMANLDVSTLNDGLHKIHVRTKDDAGQWSSVVSSFFQKLPTTLSTIDTADRKIVETIYWIDDDYANRTVTPNTAADFVNFMANIDVSALNDGLHKYNFRAKDDAGQYSSVVSSFFQKLPNNLVVLDTANRKIITAEYWFNDDYGNKVSVTVSPTDFYDFMANLDVSTLNDGLHKIHVRTKDDAGQWSSVVSSFFQKLPTALSTIDTADRKIVETIYWIDDDYANRTVTPNTVADFVNFMANIDVSALNDGLHKYNFRAKDDAGQYSSVVSSFFQKLPNNLVVLDTANRKIIAAEYWFNDDYGNKVSLTVSPTDFYDFMANLDVSTLNDGLHKIHVRTKDDAGQWSSVVSSFFQKLPPTLSQPTITNNKIVRYRYTINGNTQNLIYVNLPTPQKYFELIDTLSLPNLSVGTHQLNIQFQDSIGQWSSVYTHSFDVINPLPVELLTFTGEKTENGNLLKWTTASEQNNEGFDIERSEDGENFEGVGFVEGHGTTLEIQNYEYLDEYLKSGLIYYRLKQIDFDGQFEYSNIVVIYRFAEQGIVKMTIYPNPTTKNQITTLEFNNNLSNDLSYQIISVDGKILSNGTLIKTELRHEIRVPKEAGVYYLQLLSEEEQLKVMPFIVR